jgi:hypothetical protein
VAQEIEETLGELARNGQKIRKLSVIGYSLGGLVARYAIGLLFRKGYFDKLEPVNFTTFVTPHLGAVKCGHDCRSCLSDSKQEYGHL